MEYAAIADTFSKLPEISDVRLQEPLKYHTTFRTGGPAALYVVPRTIEGAVEVLNYCRAQNIPILVIGCGSNLLVSDKGFDGIVLSMYGSEALSRMERIENRIIAGAGVPLARLSRYACGFNLCGLAFAGGIPGTLGGAVLMNAGAYGGEMKDVIESVRIWRDGEVIRLSADELNLSYRYSSLQEDGGIVLDAVLAMTPGDGEVELARMEDYNRLRREKQPLEYPSAGSTFKRPAGFYAGKLIQDSGLAGAHVGGAEVSTKHCGFVINRGYATAKDIYDLCRYVQKMVKAAYGVDMELEVQLVGDFD